MGGIRSYNTTMLRNLDTALVRTFVVIAEGATMTAAANTLHLTQGAVSQQIKRLEDLFGFPLFQRDRRGLRLTPPGERLLGQAKKLLNLNDEIIADMTARTVEGRVRLGVPYDLVSASLAPVLKAYAEDFPLVEISLICASSPDLIKHLAVGDVDLAVVEEPMGPTSGECLSVERLVWVGAKGGAAHLKRPVPISMVADTCAFRPTVLAALRDQGATWRTVFENGSIDAATATVRTDLAVSPWLASLVPPELDILPADCGLPALPNFAINLHLPRHEAAQPIRELARRLRQDLARRR